MSVIEMFPKKPSSIPEGETPEESVARFHAKLDEVMDTFQQLSVMEKFEIMESVCSMNKMVFQLYWDIKKRHDYKENYE